MRHECVLIIRRVNYLSLGCKPISGMGGTQSKGIQRQYPTTFKPYKITMRTSK